MCEKKRQAHKKLRAMTFFSSTADFDKKRANGTLQWDGLGGDV